jgi:hypothetical protein
MNERQKQVFRDALEKGEIIQYNRPKWIDYNENNIPLGSCTLPKWLVKVNLYFRKIPTIEDMLNNRALGWQVKPPPQHLNINLTPEQAAKLKGKKIEISSRSIS